VNSSEPWLGQPELRLHELLRRLSEHGVDFVVVGGVAVILQASPRFTKDLDICYASEQENLDRLGDMLTESRARLRDVDEDLPFVPDGRALRQTQILTLTTDDGGLDLLLEPDGSPGYPALRRRADQIDIGGIVVRVASIEDLIAMKRAAGRPQDLVDLESLEIARRRRRSSPS
jgi:predicted nucleotidyltransferase